MQEPNFKTQTIEDLYTFTYSAGILDAINANNMAGLQEAIVSAAKQYGVDLNEQTDVVKTKETYRKAITESFIAHELLVETGIPGKYTVNRDPAKAKEYGNIIYAVQCKKQELEVIKATATLVKAALTAKESTLSFLAGILNLTPLQTSVISKSMLTVIGALEAVSSKLNDTLQTVREHVVKDILHYESNEPTNTFIKKGLSALSKEANEEIEKKIKGFNEVEGPTIVKAHLSDKRKERVEEHVIKTFGKDNAAPDISKDCAEFMRDVLCGQMDMMIEACMEINRECNADGRIPINIGTKARSVTHMAEHCIPQIISIASASREILTDLSIGNASRGLLALSSLLHRNGEAKDKPVARAAAKLADILIRGADWTLSVAAKKICQSEFTKAEYDIRSYNIKESGSKERGKNFAKIYGSLNVYRAGKAEYVVGAFNTFKMRSDDKMWALSYLQAGINATKAGVIFDVQRDGKIGEKEELSKRHDERLEGKAQKIYEKYLKLSERTGIEKALSSMEKEFISIHHKAIDKSKELRNEELLISLSPKTHFNHIYDNAPVKESDYIRTVDMTKEEYRKNDLNAVFIDNDAICINGNNAISLQLLGEEHIVTAAVDEHDRAVNMGIIQNVFNIEYTDHNDENVKKTALERIGAKEAELTTIAYRDMYAATFTDKEMGIKAAYKWQDVINEFVRTDGYTSFFNAKTHEFGFTDNHTREKLTITNQEPRVELSDRCLTLKQFAGRVMNAELDIICDNKNIKKEDIEKLYEPITGNLKPAEKRIIARVDAEHKLDGLKNALELITEGSSVCDVINTSRRNEITDSLSKRLNEINELSGLSERVSKELNAYLSLEQTDRELAICRSYVPECKRDGENIIAYTSNGERLAININTYEMEGFDRQNAEMRDLKNELFMALDELSEYAEYEIEELQPDLSEEERNLL